LRVILIYPRFKYPRFTNQEPLGLLYLASSLRVAGHEPVIIDLTFEKDLDRLRQVKGAELIGISATTSMFPTVRRILHVIRRIAPEVPCVVGGPHATALPEDCLATGFDHAVVGEGEETIVDLVNTLQSHGSASCVPGVATLDQDGTIAFKSRKPIDDLDSLPFPARDLLDFDPYTREGPFAYGIMVTRGCPYNCLFCKPMVNKLFGHKIRKRTPHNVADEIEEIARIHGSAEVPLNFRDDTLGVLKLDWWQDLRLELHQRGLRPNFVCQLRVNDVTPKLLELMKDCGCFNIQFGVESGSQRILNFYRKGITVSQIVSAFDSCHAVGLRTYAFIMIGAPDETTEELQQTLELLKRIGPHDIGICVTTPAPGTDLYDLAIDEGIFSIADWSEADYYTASMPMRLAYLTKHDIARFSQAMKRAVYARQMAIATGGFECGRIQRSLFDFAFYLVKWLGMERAARNLLVHMPASDRIFHQFDTY